MCIRLRTPEHLHASGGLRIFGGFAELHETLGVGICWTGMRLPAGIVADDFGKRQPAKHLATEPNFTMPNPPIAASPD